MTTGLGQGQPGRAAALPGRESAPRLWSTRGELCPDARFRRVDASAVAVTLPGRVDDLEVEHRPSLVIEDVAVEHVELLTFEAVGEIHGAFRSLLRPKSQGIRSESWLHLSGQSGRTFGSIVRRDT